MPSGSGLFGAVASIAINPRAPTTLYAGGYSSLRIFKSTSGGAWWSLVFDLPEVFQEDPVSLAIDPQTPATLYAGTSAGIFMSTDAGTTWNPRNIGLPASPRILALAINPQSPATLYAGTIGGVFKTTDAGATWTKVVDFGSGAEALVIDPQTPATLYAGTGNGGVFKSTNSGASWSSSSSGLPNDSRIRDILIDPQNPSALFALFQFRFNDRGGLDPLLPGIFKTTNGGTSWSPINPSLPLAALALAVSPNGICLHAGTSAGVFELASQQDPACPPPPTLSAALSTTSQSVQVGTPARTFATVKNLSGGSAVTARFDTQALAVVARVNQTTFAIGEVLTTSAASTIQDDQRRPISTWARYSLTASPSSSIRGPVVPLLAASPTSGRSDRTPQNRWRLRSRQPCRTFFRTSGLAPSRAVSMFSSILPCKPEHSLAVPSRTIKSLGSRPRPLLSREKSTDRCPPNTPDSSWETLSATAQVISAPYKRRGGRDLRDKPNAGGKAV